MADSFENWTVQVRKGVLELCVLSAIAEGEVYGYALVRALVEDSALEVTEGTAYPMLSRLRKQGLIDARLQESPDGPARKYYRLTARGRAQLKAMKAYFADLAAALERLEQGIEET